jgi:membrane-bound lytic murein transglycosylase A
MRGPSMSGKRPQSRMPYAQVVAALLCAGFLLAGCLSLHAPTPGTGRPIAWTELPGWSEAQLATAWPALLQSCVKLRASAAWERLCQDVSLWPAVPTEEQARAFFESRFIPHLHYAQDGSQNGLITGYYEPLLRGSRTRTERYRYPIYRVPDDLLIVDLGELYPALRGQRVRGRLDGKRVVPYYPRAHIDNGRAPLAGNELLWVDDIVELFFLQIQGSGRVQLESGEMLHVGYADQNGHPYVAIGRVLRERLGVNPEDIDMPRIRAWLKANPAEAAELLNSNPSYVFFGLRESTLPGPLGSLGVPLYAERAIAVDPNFVPLGVPVWLDTHLPDTNAPYRQLVFAQDTGGAIRGPARADLFMGYGDRAESIAGRMRQVGRLYVLLPRAS